MCTVVSFSQVRDTLVSLLAVRLVVGIESTSVKRWYLTKKWWCIFLDEERKTRAKGECQGELGLELDL